jgi:hypothetical protein
VTERDPDKIAVAARRRESALLETAIGQAWKNVEIPP